MIRYVSASDPSVRAFGITYEELVEEAKKYKAKAGKQEFSYYDVKVLYENGPITIFPKKGNKFSIYGGELVVLVDGSAASNCVFDQEDHKYLKKHWIEAEPEQLEKGVSAFKASRFYSEGLIYAELGALLTHPNTTLSNLVDFGDKYGLVFDITFRAKPAAAHCKKEG